MTHKAGFVSIIGSPNVGKSTLMNELVGERMSIITSKAQTTRHRIMGILNTDDCQVVFSDTPGVLDPNYKLQESMMTAVNQSLSDADVILLVVELNETKLNNVDFLDKLKKVDTPMVVLINKVDLGDNEAVEKSVAFWNEQLPNAEILPISALHKFNTEYILNKIFSLIPPSPPYFDKDQLTDRPMRFFVSEIIREKILLNYKKEIPYSVEIIVEEYKDEKKIVKIRAVILVSRDSQKGIIIGHQGSKLKKIGTESRKDLEEFIQKKVFLDLYVKVDKNWREKENKLKQYGYLNK